MPISSAMLVVNRPPTEEEQRQLANCIASVSNRLLRQVADSAAELAKVSFELRELPLPPILPPVQSPPTIVVNLIVNLPQ